MYEKKEKERYRDNWWFKFMHHDLEKHDYIIFTGALGYENKDFKIFKVPSQYIKDNLNHLDINTKGWIIIYLSINESIDLRHKDNLSFKDFKLN
jgi:hypothetical protein